MIEGGFYQPPRSRRTSIAIVVLIHGAAITAVALTKMEVIRIKHPPIIVDTIPNPPKPPPEPVIDPKPPVAAPSTITQMPPIVTPSIDTQIYFPPIEPVNPTRFDDAKAGNGNGDGPAVDPPVPPEPVRIDASLDRHSELQPPYPASEQRMGSEGVVSLRVLIGPDGRVRSAEKVKATSEAFYQATFRHALRNWRFKPATIDGRPVESSKVMTVRFEIEA